MRPFRSHTQIQRGLAAALAATPLVTPHRSAVAHTASDGGIHHEWTNMAHHMTDLQASLAALHLDPWALLALGALAVGLAARLASSSSKRKQSSKQSAKDHKDPT